ncbi:hypothetical protein ACJ41O_006347 [Fusarium nematophilum]
MALQAIRQSILLESPLQPAANGRQIPLRVGSLQPLIDERRNAPYISNAIRTSRYTVYDFVPRQVFYQFSRLAHAYLLTIAILQVIPGLSTTGKFTTLIPLVIFIALVIAKEGYYDWKRHRADVTENARPVLVLRNDGDGGGLEWTKTSWEDLAVGDVISLARDEDVPADIILLSADGDGGYAHVDTMALDGETNLKPKQAPTNLVPNCNCIESIASSQAVFTIENPNADLYRFDSTVTANGKTLAMRPDQVIYRGSTIRNTPKVIGMVINTGEECKIRMNAHKDAKPKKSAIERVTNYMVLSLMSYVLALATFSTIGYFSIWKPTEESRAWYLSEATVPFAEIFLGFIIMFNQVIPLSLYIGLEAIKLGQMTLINSDLAMYDKDTDSPAGVNNTNNLDDLGQISYIFTDKTGTLTENIMNLRRISIGGTSWLHRMDLKNDTKDFGSRDADDGLTTDDMLEYIRGRPDYEFSAKVTRYLLAMALCHTCLPETTEDGEIRYQGSSPDEVALVRAAKEMGFAVTRRSSTSVTVRLPGPAGTSETQVYQILDVIEFTSDRKRMSIILQCPNNDIWLICKGADAVLLPRLAGAPADLKIGQGDDMDMAKVGRSSSRQKSQGTWVNFSRPGFSRPTTTSTFNDSEIGSFDRGTAASPSTDVAIPLRPHPSHLNSPRQARSVVPDEAQGDILDNSTELNGPNSIRRCFKHVDEFAVEGLRTLIYADRFLSPIEYRDWKLLFAEAETSLSNRQERIEEVSEIIEQSLGLIGASAVEDKLQDEVPETIEKLRRANIKICMLTGDKRETAINIAHSTRICGPGSSILSLDASKGDLEAQLTRIARKVGKGRGVDGAESSAAQTAIVIDGQTLTAIEEPSAVSLRTVFYILTRVVDSIICCRASPSQKALLVNSIRDGPTLHTKRSLTTKFFSWFRRPKKPLTLAIGDGANDVSMILTANVGVGISGREGQQAARVADFSISKFRFLSRLLLVHGRHNYHRTTIFILTTFWKEIFIYLPQALFQDRAGVTGTSLYYPTSLIFVSFLTGASMLVIGTWEQDLQARTLLAIPELYVYGQSGQGLNTRTFLGWIGNALFAGFVAFQGGWMGYGDTETVSDNGLFAQGTLIFVVCITWINYKILILEMHYKTRIAIWSAVGSIAALWMYQLTTAAVSGSEASEYASRGGLFRTFGRDAAWWMSMVWVLGTLLLMEFILRSFKQHDLIRAFLARCWPFGGEPGVGGGVREGFRDWETRLWQEMEKDPAVQKRLEKLHKE